MNWLIKLSLSSTTDKSQSNSSPLVLLRQFILIMSGTVLCCLVPFMYLPNPTGRMWHKVNFYVKYCCFIFRVSSSKTGCLIKEKEPLPYYLAINGVRRDGFLPRALVLIWTWIPAMITIMLSWSPSTIIPLQV